LLTAFFILLLAVEKDAGAATAIMLLFLAFRGFR
jgi:hypothetical protein